MVAEAEAQASHSKHLREVAYASAYEYWRETLSKEGKPTEAMVNAAVTQDEEYLNAKHDEISTEQHYRTLRAISDALRMRADMLISLGAHLRAEQGMTNAHINETVEKQVRNIRGQV